MKVKPETIVKVLKKEGIDDAELIEDVIVFEGDWETALEARRIIKEKFNASFDVDCDFGWITLFLED